MRFAMKHEGCLAGFARGGAWGAAMALLLIMVEVAPLLWQ